MGFKTVVGDITKYKCDVIINSIGANTTIYGGICKSIIDAANKQRLVNIIKNVNNVYRIGEYFITDSFNITTCKKIIHLISPYYVHDNDYKQYKECLRIIFNVCQEREFHSIGIPLIGTGANEYDRNVVSNIIKEMSEAYCEIYGDREFVLVLPSDEIRVEERRRLSYYLEKEGEYHDQQTKAIIKSQSKRFAKTIADKNFDKYDKNFFDYNGFLQHKEDISVNTIKTMEGSGYYLAKKETHCISTIGEYVEEYMDSSDESEAYYRKRIYSFFAYDKKTKDQYLSSGKDAYGEIKNREEVWTVNKNSFFRIIFALKMSYKEAKDFLNYFGLTFAFKSVNQCDDLVVELLKDRQYDLVEIFETFKNRNIDFFKQ